MSRPADFVGDILITPDGDVRYVYSDTIDRCFKGEQRSTTRASHVEPHPHDPGGWLADMRPVGGPVLGYGNSLSAETIERLGFERATVEIEAFPTRDEALAAELAWLRKELGL